MDGHESFGFVPQRFALYPDLTIDENLRLRARLFGLDESRARPRAHELLARVGLDRCSARLAGNLSGGMKQKLALVAARWHVELYIDSRELESMVDTLCRLPAVSIDHLGLAREGLPLLCRLAEQGVRVKATGFGRVDFDVRQAFRDLWSANPDCLMFGTDLPSTRAPRPFSDADLALVLDAFDESAAVKILHDNAAMFYRLPAPTLMTV